MSDQHYFSRLLRKNIWIYFFSFLIAPIGYLVKILVTWSVSVEDYGVFTAVLSLIMILGAYNDFWMADSLNYFLPGYIHQKDSKKITQTISIAFFTQVISTILLVCVLYFGSDFLGKYYFKSSLSISLIHIFLPYFFIDNFFRLLSTFFQSMQDAKIQKWVEFLRNIFQLIIIWLIAFLDFATIQKYAYGYSISALLWIIVGLIFLITKYKNYFSWREWGFSKKEYFHVLKYAVVFMLSANISILLSQLDGLMITGMLWTTANGIYNIYTSLIRIPFIFLLPGVIFLMPVFSDLMKRGEHLKIVQIHTFCYELFSVLGIIMTSFFLIFWDTITIALFWPEYAASGRILLYSTPFLIFNFLLQVDFQILSASGRPRTKMYILLAWVALNLITNYIFLRLWGVVWSGLASGIGWVFIWALSFRQTRQYSQKFRWLVFWKNVIWISLLSLALQEIPMDSLFLTRPTLFAGVVGIVAIYGVAFILLNWTEFRRFKKIFNSKTIKW